MSLLMDALKKAEQAKRDAQTGSTTSAPEASEEFSLAPLDTGVSSESSDPKKSSEPSEPLAPLSFSVPQEALAGTDARAPASAAASSSSLRLDTPVDFSRSSTARAPSYPDLSAAMAVPDSDFADISRITPPGRDRSSEINETPSSRVRVEPKLEPVAKAEVRREPSPMPSAAVPVTVPAAVPVAAPAAANKASKTKANDADRDAASNVFAAKETGKKPAANKVFAIIVGVATIAATAGIGGYFWWQLQPKGMSIAAPAGNVPNQITRTPAPSLATPVPAAPTVTNPAPAAAVAEAIAVPPAPTIAEVPAPAPPTPRATSATARPVNADTEDEDSLIRVTKKPLQVSPILGRGYEALNRGDLTVARSNYEGALKADPKNTDALHGLAAIALRENQGAQAEQWFKQILVANPKDEAAMSGLIEMYSKANPAAAESRLKAIIAEHADATSPQVALGNLYSAQQRWQEAQQAYFAAYATQPDNADVLFNLAISLEHLRQPRLARQYYAEALQAARRNPARFDTSVAEDRLRALAAQ